MNKRMAVLAFFILLLTVLFLKGRGTPFAKGKGGPTQTSAASSHGDNHVRIPRITKIEIDPSSPTLESVLKVQLLAEGPSPNMLNYKYRWFVNQNEVSNDSILTLKDYRQGDTVTVEVTPSDGQELGTPQQSPPVKIGNNPPVVKSIKLSPEEAKANQEIQAEVEAVDPDGDPVSYSYTWQVNGQPVEGDDGNVLDGKYVHSADQITVTVTPRDSFSDGAAKTSQPILVANQPPEITSLPPTGIQNETYSYQIEAKDPDGDPLSYQLMEGPPGMSLDPASGLLTWKVVPTQDDKTKVKVQVADSKGGKTIQQFSIQAR